MSYFPKYSVGITFTFVGMPLGSVLANMPDMAKAHAATSAIFALLKRHPAIEGTSSGGEKVVRYTHCQYIIIVHRSFLYNVNSLAAWGLVLCC